MKDQYLKISRQVIINYLALFFSFIFGPISIFLLTRNLSVADYGVYSILSITVTVITIILDLGFPYYIVARLSGVEHKTKKNAFSSIFYFEFFFVLVFVLLLIIPQIKNLVLAILKLNHYSSEFEICLFIILASLLIRIINSYLASEKKLELQALNNMLQQSLWIFLLLAFFIFFKKIDLTSVMFVWLIGMILTTSLGIFIVRSSLTRIFSKKELKKAILFGLPLIFFNIGTWFIISTGRYVLNHYSSLEQVAYYSFAFSLISLISSLATAISGTLYPYFAEAWNANGNHSIFLNASIKYTLIVVLPCISVLFALNEQVIMTISTVKYLAAAPLVLFLLLVPLFSALNYIFTQQLLLKGKTAFLGITHLFVAFFNIILIVPLVKSYGAYGAAISTTLAYFLLFSFIITRLINKIRLNFKYLKIFRIISISIILLVSLIFIKPEGTLPIILSLIFSMILYLILLIILGVLNEEKKIILSYLRSIKDRIYSFDLLVK